MGSIGFAIYFKSTVKQYEKYLSGILNITAAHLDGDDIEQCIKSQTESPIYETSQEFMNQVRDNYDIETGVLTCTMNITDPRIPIQS